MPRMSGWPRKKSGQNTNANETTLTFADFEAQTANTEAPIEAVPTLV